MRADVSYGAKAEDGYHQFIAATGFREDGWRDYSSGQLGNVFAKIGRQQGDSNWDLSLLVGRSKLIGNGLLPSRNYGKDGDDGPYPNMYENNRRWVYTHPDQTKNELNQLTFNFQRMLDSETELAALAYVRHSKRKAYSGDVEREQDIHGDYGNEGVLNLNSSSQTSYGGSFNLTKLLDKHQITTGVSTDLAQMRYGAQQSACEVSSTRGMEDCGTAVDTAGVRGGSYAIGLYASDTWSVSDRTFVTGAARFNHANVRNIITNYDTSGNGTDRARENFNYNSLNPSLGISHKLAPVVTVFGNIGQSNRVPTIIELGCADRIIGCRLPTGLQADPYLKQVIARTLEAGTRWRLSEDSEITVAVYRTDNTNDILFQATGTAGQGYFTNFSNTRRQGLDVSVRTQVGAWSLQSSYSYLNATYQADGALFGGERDITVARGTRIAGLPEHTLRLSADWLAAPKLTLGGSVLATSSIVTQGNEDGLIGDNVSVNAKVSGYYLLNLHANYEAQKGLEYFARINNVLDRRYETYGLMALTSFDQYGAGLTDTSNPGNVSRFVAPGAPRSFMVGMRYRF